MHLGPRAAQAALGPVAPHVLLGGCQEQQLLV